MNNSQLAMMIKRLKKRCAQRLERIKQLEREIDEVEKDRDAWRNAALRWNGKEDNR